MEERRKFLLLFFSATILSLLLACTASPVTTTQEMTVEVTFSEQIPSTPKVIQITQEVTRLVKIERTVVILVTPTPLPLLSKDCWDTAMKQNEMNACAILEYQLALEDLDKTIAQIKIREKDMQELLQIQGIWQKQMEEECQFFAGRTFTDEDENMQYIGGSMAPMNVGFCMANRTKERTQELQLYFLDYTNSGQ